MFQQENRKGRGWRFAHDGQLTKGTRSKNKKEASAEDAFGESLFRSRGFPVNQFGFRMNSTIIQAGFFDSGDQKLACDDSHDFGVYVNRGQSRGHNAGIRGIVKAAEKEISRNGFAELAQGIHCFLGNEIVGADEYVRHFRQSGQAVRDAVLRGTVQCYAVEGAYPSSLSYLEEHYGLVINHEKYIVSYNAYASNLAPDVRVLVRGDESQ